MQFYKKLIRKCNKVQTKLKTDVYFANLNRRDFLHKQTIFFIQSSHSISTKSLFFLSLSLSINILSLYPRTFKEMNTVQQKRPLELTLAEHIRKNKIVAAANFDADFPSFPRYQYDIFVFDHFGYTGHLPKPDIEAFSNLEAYYSKPTPSPAPRKRPPTNAPYDFQMPVIPEQEHPMTDEKTPEDKEFVAPQPKAPSVKRSKSFRETLTPLDVPVEKSIEHVIPVPVPYVQEQPKASSKEEAVPEDVPMKRTYAMVAAQPSSRANPAFDFRVPLPVQKKVEKKTSSSSSSSSSCSSASSQPYHHVSTKISQLLVQLRTKRP